MRRLVLLPALLAILVGAPPALAWTWPVDGPVLQPFVLGGDPYASGQHRGIDVGAAEGAPVRAPAPGTVTFAGTVPGGGRSITIQTPEGYAVTLLHLGAVLVAEGDTLTEGAHVGVVGWSDDPEHTVPSVHLGVRISTEAAGYLDPLSLLPPPGPTDIVAETDPAEPAATPAVEVEGDEATVPAVEVATLPSQPEEAGGALEAPMQSPQQSLADPAEDDIAPLKPLVVVSVESAQPPAASAAPAIATTPEPSGRTQPHIASVTEVVEVRPPGAAPSAGDPTGLVKAMALVPAGAPANQPEARSDERRSRAADRLEPTDRPHRARIDRRAEPVAEAGVAATRRDAGAVERDTRGLSRSLWQPEQGASAVPASSGGAWFWRAGLATILALVASVLLMRRAGRGGQGTARREIPPSAPALGAAQGAEPSVAVEPATPAPRRDARTVGPRPGRRLERGGPGGPAKRPAAGLRGRRASM